MCAAYEVSVSHQYSWEGYVLLGDSSPQPIRIQHVTGNWGYFLAMWLTETEKRKMLKLLHSRPINWEQWRRNIYSKTYNTVKSLLKAATQGFHKILEMKFYDFSLTFHNQICGFPWPFPRSRFPQFFKRRFITRQFWKPWHLWQHFECKLW